MSISAAVTFGIGIASFCITVITLLTKQAIKEGKRDQRLDTVENEQEKDRDKIRKLYADISEHKTAIGVLENNILAVKETTERIENKLDRLAGIGGKD